MKVVRMAAFGLLIFLSWLLVRGWVASRGEAFWLLFPVWVVLGGAVLRLFPLPRQPGKSRAARLAVLATLALFPAGFYLGMVHLVGGRWDWRECLIFTYFFAVSLEFLLLYVFQEAEALQARLSRGRGRAARLAWTAAVKVPLYALLLPVLLSSFSLHRVKVPPQPVDPDLGLAYEEAAFPSHGPDPVVLRGWFFPRQEPRGTVLACHGVAANRADLLGIVWIFHEAGFQTLCFDFRGHGASGGHTVTYGERERADVLGAWDYLHTRPDVDPDRIFGFGVSMGAASLLLALPDLPDMKAAVADSSFADLESMVLHQYRWLPGPAARGLAAVTALCGWLETGLEVEAVSPLRALERTRIPIFFYHGAQDRVIPASATERLFQAYQGPKRLRIDPQAGHGLTSAEDPDRYRDEVRQFFLEAHP